MILKENARRPSPASNVAAAGGAEPQEPPKADLDYWFELIKEKPAAGFVGLQVRTLQGYRYRGGGPKFCRISARCIRYRRADLRDWAPKSSEIYVGSPAIVILPNGDYLASHDYFGTNSTPYDRTFLSRSTDGGTSWTNLGQINEMVSGDADDDGHFWNHFILRQTFPPLPSPDPLPATRKWRRRSCAKVFTFPFPVS